MYTRADAPPGQGIHPSPRPSPVKLSEAGWGETCGPAVSCGLDHQRDPTHAVTQSPTPTTGTGPTRLSLTDFLDLQTLQEIQDSFTTLTRLETSIRDASGNVVTAPTEADELFQSDLAMDWLIDGDEETAGGDQPLEAPIIVDGQTLGSIAIESHAPVPLEAAPVQIATLHERIRDLGFSEQDAERLVEAVQEIVVPNRAAGVRFLYLLANAIARLCFQEHFLRQRVEELSTLYKLSTMLSDSRDLQQVLDTASSAVAEDLKVKAVSIRLLDKTGKELLPKAAYNFSEEYLNKGPILLERSQIYQAALGGELVYIEDMVRDPRILYPEDAQREGLFSMLCCGMIYQNEPIGVIQLATAEPRTFSNFERRLLRAVSQLLAAAIEKTRLDSEREENQRMQRQLHLAADVQRRMLPSQMPNVPPLQIAAQYVPSLELGGDFYDFIDLDGHIGVCVGDVVGKGIAASLLMSSVRASLRAYAQDVYDLDEVITRVNLALSRDTRDNEFATLWYGVFDPQSMRLTYCNAGHEPPILLRRGTISYLDAGGMIVGIDAGQEYEKGICKLEADDLLLIYSDGLTDAFNFDQERFGRQRLVDGLRQCDGMSADQALNHLLWVKRCFTGLYRNTDDTTIMVIRVGQQEPSAMKLPPSAGGQ